MKKNTVEEMLPLTEAFYYILLVLQPGPAHGYGMMQEVERLTDGRLKIGPGTLYTALNTLTAKKLIENTNETDPADSRRKLYATTPLGSQVAEAEMKRMEELVQHGHHYLQGGHAQ
ncbi:PadR family transcriptional regulator [Gorillibacterium timonense]|uniref:PadR family transcriptional regulator n=1 Tax=Gorillibacterium timonense TaxID=1689269 RepID=UPI00071D7BC1|nr:PadR family transcriptional regulator [Gorillibacterium timonense]